MTSSKKRKARVPVKRRFRALISPSNLLALLILGVAILVVWRLQLSGLDLADPYALKDYVLDSGIWGPLIYILLLAVTVVVSQLPGVPLAVAAGVVWGPWLGGAYTVAGGFSGSLIAYFLGRTLGRSVMKSLTGKVVILSKAKGERYLGLIIFVSRLLPVVPFDVVSYAAGVTRLRFSLYAAVTLLGMTPSVLFLTYLGGAMVLSPTLALGLSIIAALSLLLLPWLSARYDWFGLRDAIRVE